MNVRRLAVASILLTVLFLAISSGSAVADHDNSSSGGELSLAHMSPAYGSVDLYLDSSRVMQDVDYKEVRRGFTAREGQIAEVVEKRTGDTIIRTESGAMPEEPHTVLLFGEVSPVLYDPGEKAGEALDTKLIPENHSSTPENTSRVRFVHVSPDAPPMQVSLDRNQSVKLDYSSFDEVYVEEGRYNVRFNETVPPWMNETEQIEQFERELDLEFEAGTVYTVYVTGYLNPTGPLPHNHFEAVKVEDHRPGERASEEVADEDSDETEGETGDGTEPANSEDDSETSVEADTPDDGEARDDLTESDPQPAPGAATLFTAVLVVYLFRTRLCSSGSQ